MKKNKWEWEFPIRPIPASRPRVGRWGAYYSKTYNQFRKDMAKMIPAIVGRHRPIKDPVLMYVIVRIEQPKKTSRLWPIGDVDNFAKAILDSLNEVAYVDDDQIQGLQIFKTWAPKGEPGSISVKMLRTVVNIDQQ